MKDARHLLLDAPAGLAGKAESFDLAIANFHDEAAGSRIPQPVSQPAFLRGGGGGISSDQGVDRGATRNIEQRGDQFTADDARCACDQDCHITPRQSGNSSEHRSR